MIYDSTQVAVAKFLTHILLCSSLDEVKKFIYNVIFREISIYQDRLWFKVTLEDSEMFDALQEFISFKDCENDDEVREIYNHIFNTYRLRLCPITNLPCSEKEYQLFKKEF